MMAVLVVFKAWLYVQARGLLCGSGLAKALMAGLPGVATMLAVTEAC